MFNVFYIPKKNCCVLFLYSFFIFYCYFFWSFWHQRIYDTTLRSQDPLHTKKRDGRTEEDRGTGYSRNWMYRFKEAKAEKLQIYKFIIHLKWKLLRYSIILCCDNNFVFTLSLSWWPELEKVTTFMCSNFNFHNNRSWKKRQHSWWPELVFQHLRGIDWAVGTFYVTQKICGKQIWKRGVVISHPKNFCTFFF